MRERESIIRPKSDGIPDILKKPFTPDIHPYTMMFLYLAYQEGAYEHLSKLQREDFDRYYIDGLTIEGQYDYTARGNLATLIRMGFKTLRRNVSDEVNEAFPVRMIPMFKEIDKPFITKEDREVLFRAKMSLKRRGKTRSEETKRRMSEAAKRREKRPGYREAVTDALKNRQFSAKAREKMSISHKKRWKESPERERMLEALKIARENSRKTKRIVTDKTREKLRISTINSWNKPEIREKFIEGISKVTQEQNYRIKMRESSQRLWQDDKYIARVKEGQRKARERKSAEQAK